MFQSISLTHPITFFQIIICGKFSYFQTKKILHRNFSYPTNKRTNFAYLSKKYQKSIFYYKIQSLLPPFFFTSTQFPGRTPIFY